MNTLSEDERWQKIRELEKQAILAASIYECFEKLRALLQIGHEFGLDTGWDEEELIVYERWAKIKEKYEATMRHDKRSVI